MPLFADLEPPPHGLATLRARMARRHARTRWWAGLVVAPAATAAAVFAVWVGVPRTEPTVAARAFDHPALVAPESLSTPVIAQGDARLAAVSLADGIWLVP